jgi:tetratricopeptide (TPR) repeat protein
MQLKSELSELDIDIVQMYYCNQLSFRTIYNFDRELRPKLFKRVRNFVWDGPIHEQVILDPVICNSEIEIIHRPGESHAERDLEAFRRTISAGRRLSRRLMGMYARELFMAGEDDDFIKAKDFFEAAAADTTRGLDEIKEASCVLAHVAVLENDPTLLLKYSLKDAITEMSSEMCYELGEFYFGRGDIDEAIVWYYNAAYECSSILDAKKSGSLPRFALSKCYEKLGNAEQALDYERDAAELEEEENK